MTTTAVCLAVATLFGALTPCDLEFHKVHEQRFQLDGTKALGVDAFWPGAQYVADVQSLPASVKFASADGRSHFRLALKAGDARLPKCPFELAVLVSGRSSVAFFTRKDGAVRLLELVSPKREPDFDIRSRRNLTDLRFVAEGGAGNPRAMLSAGIGQADIRFVTEGRQNVPYERDGRLFFTFSARAYGSWLGVMSIDPRTPSDLRLEGAIFFDAGDGLIRNDVAADLFRDETDGLWKAYVSNFSTGADKGAGTSGRAPGGINVAWSEESPLVGVHVMRTKSLGLTGMNEDPDGIWDEKAGKWRLLLSEFTPKGIRASMWESAKWDGPFERLTQCVDVDSTGTTILPFGAERYCLFGSLAQRFEVCSYPYLNPVGALRLDAPPWQGMSGWPHGRSWPAVAKFWKDGKPAYLLVTMDRVNFPGMPKPNWTYGKLMVYVADGARLSRQDVKVKLDNGTSFSPDAAVVRTSLAGQWRFKGLDRQSRPFGPVGDEERKLMEPTFDDSGWPTLRVPLNWWEDGRFSYDKTFRPDERFFRGYYRHRFNVAQPNDGRRRILRFEEVGAEFDLFVNGRHVTHHLGDFTPVEADVTDFLVSGENVVALRVLADFGPTKGQPYTRVYGANWDHRCVKGGVWHTVELRETPSIRVAEMLIDPSDEATSVTVRCKVECAVAATNLTLAASLVEDDAASHDGTLAARKAISLRRGANDVELLVPAKSVRRWSPDDPNLYWLALVLQDERGVPVSAALDRFGFRTMRVDGTRFRLNGETVYLVGDSLHSGRYGGSAGEPLAQIRADLLQYKRNGANLLRTAHMPAIPEVYAAADEIGLMIYDEWANAFCNDIAEAEFERNNLPEVERWIRRDYNHASVVLWSLGNEVRHTERYDICRQLDKQYDLARRLDRQKRPASTFSGGCDVWGYGREKLKTDFFDTHRYLGIDAGSWTTWFNSAEYWYPMLLDVYGEGGRLAKPLIMWECVGGGWGLHRDETMRAGDVKRYLEWAAKPCTWAGAEGVGFSGAIGLVPTLRNDRRVLQSYLADRLCELLAQDRRLVGFAPWFADAYIPGAARWSQRVFPLLRNNSHNDGRLMFRQLASPSAKRVECAVVNRSSLTVKSACVRVSVVCEGRERSSAVCCLPDIPSLEERAAVLTLPVPAGLSGRGEIRLAMEGDESSGTNAYAVTFHDECACLASLAGGDELELSSHSPALEAALRRLNARFRVLAGGETPSGRAALVVPPEGTSLGDRALSRFVADGGMLLVLEPKGLTVPGFSALRPVAVPNHLVELVVPDHPAFAGLGQSDFDTWAENAEGYVVRCGFLPLTDGLLAAKARYINASPYTAVLAEHAFGKGRVVVSCVNALGAFGENPAATRYVRNLLAYATDAARRVPHAKLPKTDDLLSRPVPTDLNRQPLVIVPTNRPVRVDFASSASGRDAPWKILFFRERLSEFVARGYRYLTVTFCSDSSGLVDLTLPERNHRNRLTHTFSTSASGGVPVTMRLDLKRDFRFANAGSFDLSEVRGEIILYNGYEERLGMPRPPVSFEIMEMKFE